MARSLTPTTAMLRELQELKVARHPVIKRQELVATGVMIVPTGTAEEWERIAIKQQADLIARCAQDRE
jgi:hypothetical protein